jgi:hypothetical protein
MVRVGKRIAAEKMKYFDPGYLTLLFLVAAAVMVMAQC